MCFAYILGVKINLSTAFVSIRSDHGGLGLVTVAFLVVGGVLLFDVPCIGPAGRTRSSLSLKGYPYIIKEMRRFLTAEEALTG
jgi:hypothetical protein